MLNTVTDKQARTDIWQLSFLLITLFLLSGNAVSATLSGKKTVSSVDQPDTETNTVAIQQASTTDSSNHKTRSLKHSLSTSPKSKATATKRSANNLSNKDSRRYRPKQLETAVHYYYFSIYNAHVYLNVDEDQDGYYSDFTLEFDADFEGGFADVYAELYLSRDGGPWVHYHTTDVFTIYSSGSGDEYQVRSRLNTDFASGHYDILIDLYEAGYPGIVATAGPLEDSDLYSLPLEDLEHEFHNDDYTFDEVTTYLLDSQDSDDFYSEFSLEFAASTLYPNTSAKARIIIHHPTEHWQEVIITEPFDFNQAGHTLQQIDIELTGGFPPGYYDIDIELISLDNQQILALAAQEFNALVLVPLESNDYDTLFDTAAEAGSSAASVSSQESGGGSTGWLMLGMLGLILCGKYRYRCVAIRIAARSHDL